MLVLILIDLHSRQADRMATRFAVLRTQCIALYSILCLMHLNNNSSQVVYSVGTQYFCTTSYSERHCTLILLLTTYEQNSGEDEHFVTQT